MPRSTSRGREVTSSPPHALSHRPRLVGSSREGSWQKSVPAGPFSETIRVQESNPLDGDRGYKVFAAGTGLIVDGPLALESYVHGAPALGPPIPTDQTCGT